MASYHVKTIMNLSYSSTLLDTAVSELSKLPGIGRRTALRLALSLLRRDEDDAVALGEAIIKMRQEIKYCSCCHNISEDEICPICGDPRRESGLICVVENVNDVLTVESTGVYRGRYHVLGGLISPLDGISPADLEIDSLMQRVANENIEEVILALSATMEGDATNFYIFRKLADYGVKITMISRGVSLGNDLDTTDELTLGRSIENRIPYK